MQNDSSKHIRLIKPLNKKLLLIYCWIFLIKSWDCFWGHQCLLSDGFFKHPDPERLMEQKMTTEHKKVTNNLRFKPCPAGLW